MTCCFKVLLKKYKIRNATVENLINEVGGRKRRIQFCRVNKWQATKTLDCVSSLSFDSILTTKLLMTKGLLFGMSTKGRKASASRRQIICPTITTMKENNN